MRGAVARRPRRCFERYVEAVIRHMWAEPKKMDDPEVVRAALDASGLDGAHCWRARRTPTSSSGCIANTERAVARGVFGSPTFFVGDEIYFGKDRLREVEEEILAAKARG